MVNMAYRLSWNPKRLEYRENIDDILQAGRPWTMWWRCGRAKILPGCRIYLVRLGEPPKGIIGVGRAVSKPSGLPDPVVKVEFEELQKVPWMEWEVLTEDPRFDRVVWDNQNLAVRVPADISKALYAHLFPGRQSAATGDQAPAPSVGTKRDTTSGAGFGDPASNAEVECAATEAVIRHYLENGWQVQDVSRDNLGYDLECKKGRKVEHVEVKGISGTDQSFIITANEWRQAEQDPRFVLFLVTSARSTPRLHRYTGVDAVEKFEVSPINYRATRK